MLRRAPSLALSLTRWRTIRILLTCVRPCRRLRRRSWRGRLLPLRWMMRAITNPRHSPQEHRRGKRDGWRWPHPCPPTLLHRLSRHSCPHPHIERRRRLDHRQLAQQIAHRAEFIHTHPANRACGKMFFRLSPFAIFQPAIHLLQNPTFHSFTTHCAHPFYPVPNSFCNNLKFFRPPRRYLFTSLPHCFAPCLATNAANSTRNTS